MKRSLDLFRALADPTRLRIVALLRRMELAVGELAQVLGQSQPRVSRHVRILCDAGIARRRKEGSWVFLGPGAQDIVQPIFRALDEWSGEGVPDPWTVADVARLTAVRADRAAAAERYFAAHAEEWDNLRSLHIADAAVEAAMTDMLGAASLGRLIDIGTGTGRMIELFGGRASHAVGIDRSPDMLRLARGKLALADGFAWELRQGDVSALPLENETADTVILHQVLHFLPAPEMAVAELGRIMAPNGRLIIVDFAPHDREELRDRDAHARLGFSDRQIADWMSAAGLSNDRTEQLDGAALTVKIWRGVKPAVPHLKVVSA